MFCGKVLAGAYLIKERGKVQCFVCVILYAPFYKVLISYQASVSSDLDEMGGRSPLSYLSTPLVSLLSSLPIQYLHSNIGDSPIVPRLEVTSDTTLRCGQGGGRMISGYAHLGNGSMYWLHFPSSDDGVKGLTLHHNGGPASSMDYPFIGTSREVRSAWKCVRNERAD